MVKILKFVIILTISLLQTISSFSINEIYNRLEYFRQSVDNFGNQFQNPSSIGEKYDFVIVGSGSAGAVLANRLSEISQWQILLLEAGNQANEFTNIPVLAPILQLTPFNWNYTMQRQNGICLGMEDQICTWPRGKALGGTTVINYMIYTRGNPHDYAKWSEHNPGWNYEDVLPYFLKSENCNLNQYCSGLYHNQGGYLNVEYPFKSRITDAFLQAGIEFGNEIVDYNSPNFMGYSQIQANQKHGRRHSVANAFLKPISKRPNLTIITSAHVSKIIIDPNTKRATGVEFVKKRKRYSVFIKKEVILSAGVFHSPQLLMLSGIGPKEHLLEHNISILQNSPVGKLLYDHIAYLGLTFKMNETIEPRAALFNPAEIYDFFVNGKGAYTSLGGVEALAYIETELNETPNYPDIELIFSGIGSLQSDYGIVSTKELRIKREIYDQVFKPIEDTPVWSIIPMLLHPKSKGFLKLHSNNSFDPPLLYGNYFTDSNDDDINTLLASIRYIMKLSKTKAFQQFDSTLHDTPLPGCEHHQIDSDDYWRCALRTLSVTLHHQVGTCRMGPDGVVDNRLKVHGIEMLRVADSSVIPITLSAHTSAPSMMIGEKTADIIKEDWGMKS